MTSAHGRPLRSHSAFTILELLVSIAIIAVLLSILLPTLRTVKEISTSAACLGNQRALGQAFTMYASVHRGMLPTYQFERASDGVIHEEAHLEPWGAWPNNGFVGGIFLLPTDHAYLWAHPIRHFLTDDPDNAPFQVEQMVSCPVVYQEGAAAIASGVSDPPGLASDSYLQSPALFTQPGAWSAGPVVINRDYAPVALSTVDHPSNKALLVERFSHHSAHRTAISTQNFERFNVLAVDGHVETKKAADAKPSVAVIGLRAGGLPCSWCEGAPFLTTAHGASGVDW